MNAECRAACDAQVHASMECQPARAELVVTGGPDEETQARAARLRETVAQGLATVLTVRERMRRLRESGRVVLTELQRLPDTVEQVGVGAAACSAGALVGLEQSLSSISVTAEVSVSVSASFTASAQ